ncbi:hypothetical protein LNP25_13570 [Klebsiella variicola subsp. variicola]|nr:hypothetical protein [Klebsiella variicola subsp. variicola]
MQLVPVRVAAEQIAFPPGGAGVDGFFSVRDIGGITLRKARNAGAEIIDLRMGAKLSGNKIMASGSSSQIFHDPGAPSARGPGEQNHTAEQQADPVIEERTE